MLKRLPKEKRGKVKQEYEFDVKKSRTFRRDKRMVPDSEENKEKQLKRKLKKEKKKTETFTKKNATTLNKQNATNPYLKNIKAKTGDDVITSPMFNVAIRRKIKGLNRKKIYPVFAIDIQEVEVPLLNGKRVSNEEFNIKVRELEMQLDEDDEDAIEDAKKKMKLEVSNCSLIWLLIGVKRTGKLKWIDSADTYYLGE